LENIVALPCPAPVYFTGTLAVHFCIGQTLQRLPAEASAQAGKIGENMDVCKEMYFTHPPVPEKTNYPAANFHLLYCCLIVSACVFVAHSSTVIVAKTGGSYTTIQTGLTAASRRYGAGQGRNL